MPDFRFVGEETVYDGYIMRVVVGTFAGPDGDTFTRDVVRHPGAVAVLPLHEDGTVTGGAFRYLPVAFERFGSGASRALTLVFETTGLIVTAEPAADARGAVPRRRDRRGRGEDGRPERPHPAAEPAVSA